MQLVGKTIIVLSPEKWGVMMVSKHLYSIELVSRGNEVFFIEPSDLASAYKGELNRTKEGVNIFTYKPFARGKKYLGKKIYSFLQRIQFEYFFRNTLKKPDVLWCFDDGGYDNLSIFNAKLTIFHAVDHNLERQTPNCSSSADFVFATSRTILSYMKPADKSGVIINHGLRKEYLSYAKKNVKSILQDKSESENLTPKNIGFWGSLLKESLDRNKILNLVEHFTDLNFHFIGPYELRDSNVGGIADFENESFVSKLKALSNVKLYGAKNAAFIIQASSKFDALINLEYQFSPRWDNGNPHKILEYLALGLPIFTTPMIAYENSTFFFITEESSDIIIDFNSFLSKWRDLNSNELRLKRMNYALCNSYEQHIMEIEEFTSVA